MPLRLRPLRWIQAESQGNGGKTGVRAASTAARKWCFTAARIPASDRLSAALAQCASAASTSAPPGRGCGSTRGSIFPAATSAAGRGGAQPRGLGALPRRHAKKSPANKKPGRQRRCRPQPRAAPRDAPTKRPAWLPAPVSAHQRSMPSRCVAAVRRQPYARMSPWLHSQGGPAAMVSHGTAGAA